VSSESAGLWGPALGVLRTWDPVWAQAFSSMNEDPWRAGVLDHRFLELVCVGLNASCTTLDAAALRRHIAAALRAGATRDELLFVIECATAVSVHALSVAAPILAEALDADDPVTGSASPPPTPSCDAMHAAGQWNDAWDPFMELDPAWTEEFMSVCVNLYATDVLSPVEIELLSIALDASVTHLYTPGIRRHIHHALACGATPAQILTVLHLCVSQGVQSINVAVPILDEELARFSEKQSTTTDSEL
jgi:alkylhydroperoxidase/carboxymuconolactone decarboxylase family protein YurZ